MTRLSINNLLLPKGCPLAEVESSDSKQEHPQGEL